MESLKLSYHRYLRYFLAKDDVTATPYDKFLALSYAVRSEMVDRWITTQRRYHSKELRRIYFLSMEYIFGRSLKQNIMSLDIEEDVAAMAKEFGFSPEDLYEVEDSFDLGNGGKARLAACLQDAMASEALPAMAYGLRYDYGQFRQTIENGAQAERPYDWLHKGHPWEIVRPQYSCVVNYYGRAENAKRPDNPLAGEWKDAERVEAVPFDFPVAGFKNCTVNTLRLWAAEAAEEFLPDYANHGDYLRACEDKSRTGTITKVLFPDEDVLRATELRLKQQYFLVSASLHDILRRFKRTHENFADFGAKVVIQLSGSNCALAVPELMRLLVDVENIPFRQAWDITTKVFAYTSNAVLRDHLEAWPVYLMNQVFPRHMQIIYADSFHLILACPDGDFNSWYLDSPIKTGLKFDTYISKEVIAFVDSAYRTWPSAKGRAIIGSSMGGHGASTMLAKHPDLYCGAGSISGILDLAEFPREWDMAAVLGDYNTNKALWTSSSFFSLCEKLAGKNKTLILDCGMSDFALPCNRKTHQKLLALKIAHEYYERQGGHSPLYAQKALGIHVRYLSGILLRPGK